MITRGPLHAYAKTPEEAAEVDAYLDELIAAAPPISAETKAPVRVLTAPMREALAQKLLEQPQQMTEPAPQSDSHSQASAGSAKVWLNTAEAALRSGVSVGTVRKAAAAVLLHSHQSGRKGRRRTHVDVVDVWVRNGSEAKQAEACGCVHLRHVKRSKSA
jgi:hypothetical protein